MKRQAAYPCNFFRKVFSHQHDRNEHNEDFHRKQQQQQQQQQRQQQQQQQQQPYRCSPTPGLKAEIGCSKWG